MIIGAASSMAFRASSSDSSLMPSASDSSAALSIALSTEVPISIGLFGDAPHRRDRDAGHQGEQAEDDHAGREAGLELVALERADQRLEDDGQHGRERHRQHDLADRRQREDHDDRRAMTSPTKLQAQIPMRGTRPEERGLGVASGSSSVLVGESVVSDM